MTEGLKKCIDDVLSEMDNFEQQTRDTSIFKLLTEPTKYDFTGYKLCNNKSCFCTGKCISQADLDKARAIVKEFG